MKISSIRLLTKKMDETENNTIIDELLEEQNEEND